MTPKNVLPPTAVARNARDLLSDGVHLAELQAQLVHADWRRAQRRLIAIVACAVAAAVLALTLLPIAFVCAALVLTQTTGLSLAASFSIVLGLGVLVVAGCAFAVWWLTRDADSLFLDSRRELSRNVEWVKNTIRGQA